MRLLKLALCSLAITCVADLAAAQGTCLNTLFARNNGGSLGGAVYFDVNVLNPLGITVESLETNTAETVAFDLDVYTTPGTRVGNETNPGAWTLVASGNAVGLGIDVPTPVDVSNFTLAQGMWGVALVMGPTAGHDYTNGDGTNQFYSNADLEISLGGASNVPFTGNIFDPRVWNGTICYTEPAECFLLAGFRTWNFQLGNDTVLVEPLLVVPMTLANLPTVDVPNNSNLIGMSVYVQSFMYNPAVYPNDPIMVSDGLHYDIGNSTAAFGPSNRIQMWPIGSVVAQPGGQIAIGFSLP